MEPSQPFQVEALDAMRVARVSIESENPEMTAFKVLVEWVGRNESEPLQEVRFFGFNDPCPEPGQSVYRYEAWMTVSERVQGEGGISVAVHPGHEYAVVTTPLREIKDSWDRLVEAVKSSRYELDSGPALEEALGNPLTTPFDEARMKLYLPIK